RASGNKCERCWNWSELVGSFEEHPEVCERCYDAIK
ncbi:MAG: zinc finger domain-containing protein, partial [Dissulfurispiraceae bacterium]